MNKHRAIPFFASMILLCAINCFAEIPDYSALAIISPLNEAQISSQMDGKVTKINFLPGDNFNQGETLIQFDCHLLQFQLKRHQAETEAKKAKYDSQISLHKLKSSSNLELTLAKSEYNKAKAELAAIEYKVDRCQIKAPFSGEVVAKSVNENEIIKLDDPLLSIVSNKQLRVQMYVPSQWLNKLIIGTSFSLVLQEYPGIKIKGQVTKFIKRVDAASQSILVYGKLMPKHKLSHKIYAGMSGRATFNFKD